MISCGEWRSAVPLRARLHPFLHLLAKSLHARYARLDRVADHTLLRRRERGIELEPLVADLFAQRLITGLRGIASRRNRGELGFGLREFGVERRANTLEIRAAGSARGWFALPRCPT